MTLQDFLAWLYVVELNDIPPNRLREVLETLLLFDEGREEDPENDLLGEFYSRVEDQLNGETFDLEEMQEWPDHFTALQKRPLRTLAEMESNIEALADGLGEEEISSQRSREFQHLLKNGSATPEDLKVVAARSALTSMEEAISTAWDEYHADPFELDAITAESVASHRFLLEGFDCWFEAFDLMNEGELEKAIASANEGNRLMMAVSIWSDNIEGEL